MIRTRSNEDAVEMLGKAKDLMESATEMLETACDMLKQGMSERNGMDYRNQSRDSRGRYMSNRNNYPEDERMMRREEWPDDEPRRGRYGY